MFQVLDTDGQWKVLQTSHAIFSHNRQCDDGIQAGQSSQLAGAGEKRNSFHFLSLLTADSGFCVVERETVGDTTTG